MKPDIILALFQLFTWVVFVLNVFLVMVLMRRLRDAKEVIRRLSDTLSKVQAEYSLTETDDRD